MIVTFTGTRAGMTGEQDATVRILITEGLAPVERGIHGDCLGADATFHMICMQLGVPVEKHPCNMDSQRAYTEGGYILRPPRPPLERNRTMVDRGDVLVATPKGFAEEPRGGTWATIRYAVKMGKPFYIVWPDGDMEIQ